MDARSLTRRLFSVAECFGDSLISITSLSPSVVQIRAPFSRYPELHFHKRRGGRSVERPSAVSFAGKDAKNKMLAMLVRNENSVRDSSALMGASVPAQPQAPTAL